MVTHLLLMYGYIYIYTYRHVLRDAKEFGFQLAERWPMQGCC